MILEQKQMSKTSWMKIRSLNQTVISTDSTENEKTDHSFSQ